MRKSIQVAAKRDDPSRSSTFSFSAARTDQSIDMLMGSPGGLHGPATIPVPVAPVSSAYMSSKRCDGDRRGADKRRKKAVLPLHRGWLDVIVSYCHIAIPPIFPSFSVGCLRPQALLEAMHTAASAYCPADTRTCFAR